jgi:aerobic-type carbon monoxide dehydrogenase small subunit (CoxS/CutS family)
MIPAKDQTMDRTIAFTVNGQPREVTTDPKRPLLEVLREELQLTGTKYGCGEGVCRACTVLVDGKSVASCMTPMETVEKRTVTTIEGVAKGGRLHPVQEAFLAESGFQCGYCTPGMILEVIALLNESPKASEADLLTGMRRHVCRCCNYPNLVRAIRKGGAK